MTWSYDVATISSSTTVQVRFIIGDTDQADQLLQDEEIAFALTEYPNINYAAARCCEAIAALFARKVTTQVGSLKVMAEKKYEHYLELAESLRKRAAISDALPHAPAVSMSDKQATENDTDRVLPAFTGTTNNNPNVGPMDPLFSRAPWSTWP